MQNINIQDLKINNRKTAFGGLVFVLIFIFSVAFYNYLKFDESVTNQSVLIDTKFFNILKLFKEKGVNFSNIETIVDSSFTNLKDVSTFVEFQDTLGRENPFLK